ncbi:hypothetical protein H310_07457 [Aphanomyces invadans]|uniref:Uncharacterized protein n=1 Tax=Aphanomyces invadans TaxID=157072 RepID=A0A024U2A4_9STRA|nr:hypothetical protein H310_07457 [Aphanomyces invadans]ETW00017.1 hypothetical protein H310_07457 [Aphanomyces invadans]|eukprot:XP_008871042.1 hypothetical protein H310_07457 [Aphanomyces invadans]
MGWKPTKVTAVDDAIARHNAATCIQQWYRCRRSVPFHRLTLTLLGLIKQLDRDLVLFWKLLHEGLTVFKYNYTGKVKSRRILCFSPVVGKPMTSSVRYLFRASTRLLPTEKGLYLADIAEVRPGLATYSFSQSPLLPIADKCFSIIGSERTLSLEMPSRNARDQAVSRFRVLVDVLQGPECILASREWMTPTVAGKPLPPSKIENVYASLLAGVHVLRHSNKVRAVDHILWVDLTTQTLHCGTTKQPPLARGVALTDITEIRKGVNSHGFSIAAEPPIAECFSVIGSERTLDCQVHSVSVRDTICLALQYMLIDCATATPHVQLQRQAQYARQPPTALGYSLALQL